MKKHPEQNEQFEAQLRNLPDTVNQSLAGLTAGTELNNRIQMAVRDSRASRQKKSFPVRRFVSVAGVCAAAVALFVGLSPLLSSPANAPLIQSSPLGDKPTATERTLCADLTGSDVSIGHNAVIHGAVIGDDCLIGMGATILDNAVVPPGCIIAANALVLSNARLEPDSVYAGVPAKKVKDVTPEQREEIIRRTARDYRMYASWYE